MSFQVRCRRPEDVWLGSRQGIVVDVDIVSLVGLLYTSF